MELKDYIIDEEATSCDFCKKRKSKFISNFYQNLHGKDGEAGIWCYFCASLYETDLNNFCEKIEDPIALITSVYCDGGLLAMNRLGGVWSWCGVNITGHRVYSQRGTVLQIQPHRPVTNNHTEQIAIIKALEALPKGWSGTVYSDSNVALGRIFDKFGTKNLPTNIIQRSIDAVERLGKLKGSLLQGHPTENDLIRGIGERRNLPVSIHNHFVDISCELEKKEYFDKKAEDEKGE